MSLPWGAIEWVINHPELGWILLFGWLLFELRHDKGRIYQLDKKITGAIIVIRALAQQQDAIDEDKVDDYLVENGMKPQDFFVNGEDPLPHKSFEEEEDGSDEALRRGQN